MNADISEELVLQQWHAAVNSGNIEETLRWCSPDILVHGPRGAAHGHDAMRQWIARTGIRLEPQAEFGERDGRFVVPELARWTTQNAPSTEPVATHCVFTVAEGLVTSIARYDDPAEIPASDS